MPLIIIVLAALMMVVGCKSNPNKAQKIDTEIDKSAQISGTKNSA